MPDEKAAACEAPEPVAWVHPAYMTSTLAWECSPMRLSQQQVPLYLAPVDQSARIAELLRVLGEQHVIPGYVSVERIRAALSANAQGQGSAAGGASPGPQSSAPTEGKT